MNEQGEFIQSSAGVKNFQPTGDARSELKRRKLFTKLLILSGLLLSCAAACQRPFAGYARAETRPAASDAAAPTMQTANNSGAADAVAAKKTPVLYVAFGDSTGVGVGARSGEGYVARLFKRIKQERAGSVLKNYSVSGASSDDVLRRQLDAGLKNKPTLVTLGIGVNDVGRGVSADDFARNFTEIIKRIRAATDAPIIVANLPDFSFAPRVPEILRPEARSRVQLFNTKIVDIAARENLTVVDLYTPTHELLTKHREFFSEDGFHPSDAGYEQWAEIMWPAVSQALP